MAIPANVLTALQAMLAAAEAAYATLCANKTTDTCEYMGLGIMFLEELLALQSVETLTEQQWGDALMAINTKLIAAMKPPAA
jgi:hypothetical protein